MNHFHSKEGFMCLHNFFRLHHRVVVCLIMMTSIVLTSGHGAHGQGATKTSQDLSTAIVQVAKKNIPAVVHIEVTGQQEMAAPSLPFENDPFFRYFFGLPKGPRKFKRETKGLGTGMIIDGQGHVLTNYHVVGGANKIEVTLSDGSKYTARLIGTDPKTDLAVVKITAKERFPFVTFGDSDKVEVGEWVIAIGHPRGLDQTVTQGIISAKHRRGITDPTSYQDFLQTDAAINPGNSGGPLLNLRGEVIGINTVIVSGSGGFEGIGLSIPSNMAVHVARLLIAKGKVERGWLGISAMDLTPENTKGLGVTIRKGAFISDVVKGGPADRGGLRKGDIVVSYEGKDMPDAATLRNEIAITPIGEDVRVTVLRGGRRLDLTVRTGTPNEATRVLGASIKERLGVEVRSLTPKETERYGTGTNQGVVLTWVDPRGPLGRVGFEMGDLILEVNGQAVAGKEGFVELVAALRPNQQATLLAVDHSSGTSGYVQVVVK